jgi:F-type H+-transporting ATPase subunit epsilon
MAEYTPYPVEVITPEGTAFSGDAQIVVVPGESGQLGVLANHAPLISALKPGEMHVTDAAGTVHAWACGNGYIEVRKNEALVLVGDAVSPDEIDSAAARARLDQARAELEHAQSGDGDVSRAEREVAFAESLVRVSGGAAQ